MVGNLVLLRAEPYVISDRISDNIAHQMKIWICLSPF